MKIRSFPIGLMILVLFSANLTGCGGQPASPTLTPSATQTPTLAIPTQTATPTEPPDQQFKNMEQDYKKTLTPEQLAVYEKAPDMTKEGRVRKFLDGDFSTYLAYYDEKEGKDKGEVVAVFNQETQKLNPALYVEGGRTLFINEVSKSEMIYNPEMDKQEAEKTMADYMNYVRLNLCALSNGINLSNVLDKAIANEDAQKLLEDGCTVTLRAEKATGPRIDHKYNIPTQTFEISSQTGVVIKFIDHETENMYFSESANDPNNYKGISYEKNQNGQFVINSLNQGAEDYTGYNFKDRIFARRIEDVMNHLFNRISGGGSLDTVTQLNLFDRMYQGSENITPPIIYSQTR